MITVKNKWYLTFVGFLYGYIVSRCTENDVNINFINFIAAGSIFGFSSRWLYSILLL